MRASLVLGTVLVVSSLVGGCATADDEPDRKAAMVIAQGGLGDESYNDLAMTGFAGVTRDRGLEGSPIETEDVVAQGEQMLRRAATGGYGLVIDLEYTHAELIPPIAAEHPKVKWTILNAEAKGDNVLSVLFAEQDGSYLAGALAAMMTTATGNPKINPGKKLGVIGGTKSVGIDKFISGYIQGAKDVDPAIEVLVSYSNTFGDPTKGSQMATTMYEQGADIVYHVAGGTGSGVLQAAKATNHYAIGVDTDQDDLAPGFVLTSMVKRTDLAVRRIVEMFADDKFAGGQTLFLGLGDGGVSLSEFKHTKQDIPEQFRTKVDELKSKIISGELKVWNVVDQGYPAWLSGS